jgi:hypothetical protein
VMTRRMLLASNPEHRKGGLPLEGRPDRAMHLTIGKPQLQILLNGRRGSMSMHRMGGRIVGVAESHVGLGIFHK